MAQYRIDQWTADDGLPQNSVYGIVQTRDGYLWLATVDGLTRFDGSRFSIFNKSNSPGIINNRFLSLFETPGGDLWAGTEESGAVRFRTGLFENYRAEAGVPASVVWIESSRSGEGAIIHSYDQTVRFSGEEASPFHALSDTPSSLPAGRTSNMKIFCRFTTSERSSECFVNGGWQRFSLGDHSSKEDFLSVAQDLNADGSRILRFVLSAAQEANGIAWLITEDGRLAQAENGRVTRFYDERDGLPKYLLYLMTGERLGLVAKDAEGSLWMVDLPSMRKELLFKKDDVPKPLYGAETLSTYADGEGNLWFGTTRDGLFRARKQIIKPYSAAEGITNKTVYPVYQDRLGTIWTGATEGLYKRENDRFEFVESTEGFLVNAIGEDDAGRLLIENFGTFVCSRK